MLAKRTYKNQITIPKEIIAFFGNVEYFDVERRGDEIVLSPVEISSRGSYLASARKKMKQLGISEKDVDSAVRWARSSHKNP
ncbi:AbrB/MazE/SpoVT family DNA-binding domain-containing protein [Elusimicrobiota bacterium]